jgi:hypothetical protein
MQNSALPVPGVGYHLQGAYLPNLPNQPLLRWIGKLPTPLSASAGVRICQRGLLYLNQDALRSIPSHVQENSGPVLLPQYYTV